MTAAVFKLNTGSTTNLTKIKDGPANLKGLVAINTAAYAIFVKFFWFVPSATAATPTVGTTVPDLTFQIPTIAAITPSFPDGMSKAGQLYMAVTKVGTDADATAVVAGDGIISVLYE
jgi:hypothetical protein